MQFLYADRRERKLHKGKSDASFANAHRIEKPEKKYYLI
jgi:hypothetical protein